MWASPFGRTKPIPGGWSNWHHKRFWQGLQALSVLNFELVQFSALLRHPLKHVLCWKWSLSYLLGSSCYDGTHLSTALGVLNEVCTFKPTQDLTSVKERLKKMLQSERLNPLSHNLTNQICHLYFKSQKGMTARKSVSNPLLFNVAEGRLPQKRQNTQVYAEETVKHFPFLALKFHQIGQWKWDDFSNKFHPQHLALVSSICAWSGAQRSLKISFTDTTEHITSSYKSHG